MTTRPKLSIRLAIVAALVCSVFVFARNKEKDKDKENNSEVKFSARAELVLVPSLVTDKAGNHITGLKKEDFTVLENGIEQKLATFEEITSDARRMSRPGNPNEFSNSVASVCPPGFAQVSDGIGGPAGAGRPLYPYPERHPRHPRLHHRPSRAGGGTA